eukprot:TCONS_00000594-protein
MKLQKIHIIISLYTLTTNLEMCYGTTINSKVLRNHTIIGKHGKEMRVTYISMKRIQNKLLLVVPIGGGYVSNSDECQKKCALTINCIAMNLQPTAPVSNYSLCHLLDKDHYKRPHLLVDAEDSEYHVVSSGCLNKTNPMSPKCQPSEAGVEKTTYCHHNYSGDENYECRCRKNNLCFLNELKPVVNVHYDRLPFARNHWFIKFNLTLPSNITEDGQFFRFNSYSEGENLGFTLFYLYLSNKIYANFREPSWIRTPLVVDQPQPNQVMDIEAKSFYNSQTNRWQRKIYLDGVLKAEETTSTTGAFTMNDVTFILGSTPATITDFKYSLTEPSEIPIVYPGTRSLIKLPALSRNWMFHFEFKLTSDTLLSPASSSILIVDANEGSLFYVIVKDPLTLDFSGVGSFQPQKNVYHKVVITQFFSPFQ